MKPQYLIPVNFAQEGKVYGTVNLRNAIEAIIVLGLAILFIKFAPLELKTTIYISIIIFMPLIIVCIIGINGFSFTQFIQIYLKFRKDRTILKKPTPKDKIMREKLLIEKREKRNKAIEKERKKEEREKKSNKYTGVFSKRYKEDEDE